MEKIILNVDGMHCKSCKSLIEDALNDLNVKSNVLLDENKVAISFDKKKVSVNAIKQEITKLGYLVIR